MATTAMTAPPPAERPDLLGQLVVLVREFGAVLLVPVLGWIWRELRAWRKKRERVAELFEAIAEEASLGCDWRRFRYGQYDPEGRAFEDYLDGEAYDQWELRGRIGLSPREQWERLKDRNRELRARIWRDRGFPEQPDDPNPEAREEHAAYVRKMRELKQTARWKVQEKKPQDAAPAPEPASDGGPVA